MIFPNILPLLFSRKVLHSLSGLAILAFLISLWHRYAYIDDCWFGEQAYWLARQGIVRTETIQAGLGWEQRLFVYHKLNIWIGALIVKYIGWSVYYFKTFTLLVYLSFFYLLYKYLRFQKSPDSREYFCLSALLVFANPLMFIYGFIYRPEILVMVLGFGSFIAIEKVRTGILKPQYWAILAGIASGAAFLAHLNGIIFGLGGFVYLLIYRKYKVLPAYLVSLIIIASAYFIDLFPAGNMEHFLIQMKNWPDAVSGNYFSGKSVIWNVLLKLGSEHQRFFWSDKAAVFSGIFFLSALISFRYLKENHRPLLIYTGLLILLLNLFGSQVAERYLIYYLPMMSLVITYSVFHLVSQKRYAWLSVLSLALLLQFGILAKHCAIITGKNSDFPGIHREIGRLIPLNSQKVLAPYHYIFNEMGVRPLLTYHSLEYFEVKNHRKLAGDEALTRCKELGVDCIIVDSGLESDPEKYNWFRPAIEGSDPNYEVFKRYKGYIILSAVPPTGLKYSPAN